MTLTIVVLDQYENFLSYLDPELCDLTEEIEYGGLRTLKFTYKFQDVVEDKEYFKIGNKLWIQGDTNLDDCLYVINTPVSLDVYDENQFSLELEEVLVELNYAPVFSQTELTSTVFRVHNTNNAVEVYCDWNALNYWFGDYFNIGLVQKCLSENASKVTISGTINRMNLLRQIEEETGNVFVTRYEKDQLDNTIHRYIDFLNPINSSRDWNLTLQYDFQAIDTLVPVIDEDGNPTVEDNDWEVTPFDDGVTAETITEDTEPYDESQEHDTARTYDWDAEDETVEDYYTKDNKVMVDFDPDDCDFRICNKNNELLNTDGEVYNTGDTPLRWDCSDVGIDPDDEHLKYTITLARMGTTLGLDINNTSFAAAGQYEVVESKPYINALKSAVDGQGNPITILSPSQDTEVENVLLPDNVYFLIYNHSTNKVLFRTLVDTHIGIVHEEVLDFGFNLENIQFDVDETETYSAVSPIIKVNDTTGDSKALGRTEVGKIINAWKNLSIGKGDVVPMIVQKISVNGTTLNYAKSVLGTYNLHTNYWARPLKPNDNLDSDTKTYEFFKAIAYWKAPYTKNAGELHVTSHKNDIVREYNQILTRNDTRNEKSSQSTPKMGNTETSDEDVYAIYNQVCLYLQEHEHPDISIDVDVANLIGHEYNNYQLHDKVYIKMPNTQELMTARVTKTSKEAHDVAKNTITLDNYKTLNTVKTILQETHINANDVNFKYPNSKKLTVQLENLDYDSENPDSINYPVNKLLTFTVYKIENSSRTFTGKTYTKITDSQGKATITIKYDPGDYEIDINFAGDEEYLDTTNTIKVNVSGTKTVAKKTTTNKKKTKSKTTKKTSKKTKSKTKTVKTYWTKCGLSPDKKQIISVAKPSSADAGKYGYRLYRTVFKNYCPNCGRKGYLRFDGGKKNKCITSTGAHGRGYKIGVPEHEITCIACDSDYCGVTGQEKSYGHVSRLKTIKKPVKSSNTEYNKLVKGKLVYGTKKVTVKTKSITPKTKTRKIRAKGIHRRIKNLALNIVGNKTGAAAAHAIVDWIDDNIKYARYSNFQRSPVQVLNKKSGNCCDVTRFCLQMLDAAGCTEFYKMYYVHVPGHVYAQLVTKKTGKKRYVDCASDYHGAWGYVCRGYAHGSPTSRYPKLPF